MLSANSFRQYKVHDICRVKVSVHLFTGWGGGINELSHFRSVPSLLFLKVKNSIFQNGFNLLYIFIDIFIDYIILIHLNS